jgi:ubiquinone/menaquinone biosynthesis C-methylase UbiE
MHITKKDKEINNKLYKEYERLHMEDGWNKGDKDIVYQKLVKITEITKHPLFNATVLDVGCGTGDLSAWLRMRNIKEYTGIDIYKPALEKAKVKYPKEDFILGDILEGVLDGNTYDFVFCSGALTTKLATDNYKFIEAMLRKMWQLTKIGLVFNFLSDEDKEPDADLFFYNINKVISMCKRIDPDAKIHIEKNHLSFQTHFYIFNK